MSEQLSLDFPGASDFGYVKDATEELQKELNNKGHSICRCCGRVVRIYKRKLHAEMAIFLIKLVKKFEKEPRYYTTNELLKDARHLRAGGTDGGFLVHWGLIGKAPINNRAGAPASSYIPTKQGIEFAHNRIKVPHAVWLLDKKVVRKSDDVIGIESALGTKFQYSELMQGRFKGL